MDKKTLLRLIRSETLVIWGSLCDMYTPLVHYNEPKIELNSYLWRTAGQCYQLENRVQLAYKFFKANPKYSAYMLDVILPHEIIHQADYNLFGESELKCGHGVNWQNIMLQYGLDADPYHTMEILKNA